MGIDRREQERHEQQNPDRNSPGQPMDRHRMVSSEIMGPRNGAEARANGGCLRGNTLDSRIAHLV
jgi:hypothetical protein